MNTDAMITQLGVRWRDPTFVVRSRVTWLDYLNKALRKFIKRSRFPMSTVEATLAFAASDRSKELPADVWGVKSAFDLTNGAPLTPLYNREQQAALFGAGANTGPVTHFWIEDNDLFLGAPPRVATNVRIRGMSAIADLTDAAAAPLIPSHYHRSLMDGALETSFRDDQNLELAREYGKDFEEAIQDARREFNSARLGRNVPMRNDYFEPAVNPLGR